MSDFIFKKSLGQNFLKDKNISNKIVNSLDIEKDDLIIEIGPGNGSLTKELINKTNNLVCFEIDKRLEEYLSILNTKVIYEDFLNVDLKEYTKDYKNISFIGNLPYYITTPIIMKIINEEINIKQMVFMIQKEVGERICAHINTKAYNSLTVFLNYYFNIEKVTNVSKNCFIPKPKVDSVVLKFNKKEEQNVKNKEHLFKLIRDSFKYKRKNIRNNLKEYDLEKINEVLKKYHKNYTFRAEAITLKEFIEISNYLN